MVVVERGMFALELSRRRGGGFGVGRLAKARRWQLEKLVSLSLWEDKRGCGWACQ